jgi:hypothetical protein
MPRGPQIASAFAQGTVIFGGPLIAIVGIEHYPVLILDHTLYTFGLSGIAFWFLASFAFFGKASFPRGMPGPLKIAFRAGWGLCMTGLVIGILLIANGYDTPLFDRDATVVAKHRTLQRDPSRRTYYLETRAWAPLPTVVELGARREVYDRLEVAVDALDTPEAVLQAMPDGGHVRLVLGEGRFGWDWLRRIELR